MSDRYRQWNSQPLPITFKTHIHVLYTPFQFLLAMSTQTASPPPSGTSQPWFLKYWKCPMARSTPESGGRGECEAICDPTIPNRPWRPALASTSKDITVWEKWMFREPCKSLAKRSLEVQQPDILHFIPFPFGNFFLFPSHSISYAER